jgi:hypothetical protein
VFNSENSNTIRKIMKKWRWLHLWTKKN